MSEATQTKRRGNPLMVKGGPSLNENGRAGKVDKAAGQAAGGDGVLSYSGGYYAGSGESHVELRGSNKWKTYANAVNQAVVATGIRYFGNLLAGTSWHAEPNEAGGRDAERGAEIVRMGLLEAPLRKPWPMVVRKAAMYRIFGFSLHATAFRRRPDGVIVYSKIAHRPQHTIEKWNRKTEFHDFESVTQRSRSSKNVTIPLDECLYCDDDILGDAPDGVGLLRHVIDYVRRLGVYEGLEGVAYQSDMAGTPVGRAPLAEIAALAGSKDALKIQVFVDGKLQNLRDVIKKRIKTPEELAWIILDSAPFQNKDGTFTDIQKWALDIIKSTTNGIAEMDTTIKRVELQIARVLGIEFALMGSDGGAYAQHADKTSMFGACVQTTLDELSHFATNQLARRLIARNGLDPETCTPKCVADPISTDDIEKATAAFANIYKAPTHPEDQARNVFRQRLRVPPEPEGFMDLPAPRRAAEPDDELDDDDLDGNDPTVGDKDKPSSIKKRPYIRRRKAA